MILFVTGQYAGAQYIHPLLEKWSGIYTTRWQLVATSSSCKYWDECGVSYTNYKETSSDTISLFLDTIKPTLVVISASATVELEYIFTIEAKKKNIPTASYIDIWTNYSARFQYKDRPIYPDHVLAIDDRCAEELTAEGVPENIIKIIGQPYLEKVAADDPVLGNNLLIVSQPIRKYYKNDFGYDETEFLNLCLNAVEKLGLNHVHITRHPDDVGYELESIPSDVTCTIGKGIVDVAKSHTVLGMFSMQMIVGYLWGRKVISIQPGLCKNDPSPLSRWGLIPRLDKVEDIVTLINEPNVNNNMELKDNLKGSVERLELFCLG